MRRPAQTLSEKMIKVDHVGENGAVNIYRAQALISAIFAPRLRAQLLDFQSHEQEHRKIFSAYLVNKGIRRCVSYHASGIGGFILGSVTGLIGQRAIFATTYAVENVVLDHLEHQMDYLAGSDVDAFDAVSQIYEDEKSHLDTAHAQLDKNSILTQAIIWTVKLCTNGVIRFGMR